MLGLAATLAMPLTAAAQASLGDGRLALIDDPVQVTFPAEVVLAPERLHDKIDTALAAKGWRIESEQPGRMELLRVHNRDRHTIRVELSYDARSYVIRYVESNNLLYGERTVNGRPVRVIHKNYNAWVRELATALNSVLGVAAPIMVGLPVAAGPEPAAQQRPPASDALPRAGAQWTYAHVDRKYGGEEKRFTVRAETIDGWTVHETRRRDPGSAADTVTIRAQELGFVQPIGTAGMAELAPYFLAANPEPAGRVGHAPNPGRLRASWKLRITDVRQEAVQVPAGAFQATRVEITGTSNTFSSSARGRFKYVAWYVPQVKRYVMLQQTEWDGVGALSSDEMVALVEYQP